MMILHARATGNASVNLTIGDGSGEPVGHLVFVADDGSAHPAEPSVSLHIRQLAVKHGHDLIWVTLGKLLDPQLAGRSNRLVVRIEKSEGYEVMTVCRGTGRPGRYTFREDEVAAVRLSLDQ